MNATNISLMRLRFEKAIEEYYNSEESKCKCPRCLSHKEPTIVIETVLEESAFLFGLFSSTRAKHIEKNKCVDCWTEFEHSEIAKKHEEQRNKYIEKHKNYELKSIPTSLGYEYNWEIIYL